jgi:imidazolonepropionase-like amidohydrolase
VDDGELLKTKCSPGRTPNRIDRTVQAGIPAPKVLQLDTLGAARIMKRDQELGTIAPGKLADVILMEGYPSTHISDIRRVTRR